MKPLFPSEFGYVRMRLCASAYRWQLKRGDVMHFSELKAIIIPLGSRAKDNLADEKFAD